MNSLDQLIFGFGPQVYPGGLPLAYLDIQVPEIHRNLNLVSNYDITNRTGLATKNFNPSVSITYVNGTPASGSAISNQLVAGPNLLLNPEFENDLLLTGGDFSIDFANLIVDPSFELQTGWSGNASYKFGTSDGVPRTGNGHLEMDAGGDFEQQVIPGITATTYIAYGYSRREDPTFAVNANFEVYVRKSDNTVLTSFILNSAPTGSTYEQIGLTMDLSSFAGSGVDNILIKLNPIFMGGHNKGQLWDDIALYRPDALIPYWTEIVSQGVSNSYSVLGYNEASNKFLFGVYHHSGFPANYYHNIASQRIIYKNNLYAFTQDFCDRYFNTQDVLYSDPVAVVSGSIANLNFTLTWPGARAGLTLDMDNTIRGAFAEPFHILVLGSLIPVNKYGYITAVVEGLNVSNVVTETPLSYTIGPAQSNLPAIQLSDSETGLYYVQMSLPRFQFTNALTVKARVKFKFVATLTGIKNASFNLFSPSLTGGISNYNLVQVYSFTDQIKIDGVYNDKADSWRLLVKDGIFERPYTMQSTEPTGSWLWTAGYLPGDDLKLIYTVPEYDLDLLYDNQQHLDEERDIECTALDNHTLFLGQPYVRYINSVTVNGSQVVTGYVDINLLPTQYPNLIKSVDPTRGTIVFIPSINNRDEVIASYYYTLDRYIYKGYYDGAVWHDLDLNPGAGHRYGVGEDTIGIPSYLLVNNGVTMYLLPSAAYLASGEVTGAYVFASALSLPVDSRPTNFVRHVVGTDSDETITSNYPSAAMLAKIFITPPGTLADIKLLDIRSRGGGLPDGYDNSIQSKPIDFVEETRVKIAQGNQGWTKTGVILYDADVVTIDGLGAVSGSLGSTAIKASGSLYGLTSTTFPASSATGFLVSTHYSASIGGSSSGMLYLKVIDVGKGEAGDLFAKVQVRRKFSEGSNWDIGSWDGQPTMINGVCVIQVPKDVLTGANGYRKLTAEQVEDSIRKHMAAGCEWITRYV